MYLCKKNENILHTKYILNSANIVLVKSVIPIGKKQIYFCTAKRAHLISNLNLNSNPDLQKKIAMKNLKKEKMLA